jgi:transcriptional regulator with XRE-family HTH domain
MPRSPQAVDKIVGARIARRRQALGITQAELAKQVGLSTHQIQKYETGANRVSASTLVRIATCMGDHAGAYFPDSPIPFGAGPPRSSDLSPWDANDRTPWSERGRGVSEAGIAFLFDRALC